MAEREQRRGRRREEREDTPEFADRLVAINKSGLNASIDQATANFTLRRHLNKCVSDVGVLHPFLFQLGDAAHG